MKLNRATKKQPRKGMNDFHGPAGLPPTLIVFWDQRQMLSKREKFARNTLALSSRALTETVAVFAV